MEEIITAGDLRASEEVEVELAKKDDEVNEWAHAHPEMFVAIDAPIQGVVTDILEQHPKLLDTRKGRSGADPFVIALAQTNECAVVTGESRTNSLKRPNIPDVCDSLGIQCLGLLELMEAEGWDF